LDFVYLISSYLFYDWFSSSDEELGVRPLDMNGALKLKKQNKKFKRKGGINKTHVHFYKKKKAIWKEKKKKGKKEILF